MTLAQLRNIPEFAKLQADPRFIALLQYAASNPKAKRGDSASLEHKAGEFQGWFDCLELIADSFYGADEKPKEKEAPRPAYTFTPKP